MGIFRSCVSCCSGRGSEGCVCLWIGTPEAVAANYGREISFIGHSNGTYILASALSHYATVKVKNVALLGSIVPRSFPWDAYCKRGRVGRVRTDISADDYVVAVFGRFFESVRENLNITMGSFGDIGSSGFHGFMDDSAHEYERRYVAGGHGGAVGEQNQGSLADFATGGQGDEGVEPGLLVKQQSSRAMWLSKFAAPVVVGMVAALAVGGWGVAEVCWRLWGIPKAATWIVYAAAILTGLSIV